MGGRIPLGVLAAAAIVVAVGMAGVMWATAGGSSVGDTARFVPADAVIYATVNTDPASRQWVQTAQLLERLSLDERLRGARDDGLAFADLDWDAEIAPFLGGEATVAVTSLDGDRPQVLVVLATDDGERAWNHAVRLLDERTQAEGVRPGTRDYRGATIRTYDEQSAGGSLWITRRGDHLIVGSDPAQAAVVLDLAAGKGEALAGLDRFRAARAAVPGEALVYVYVNPSLAEGAFQDLAATMVMPATPAGAALRSAGMENAAFALAVTAERTGFRFAWHTVGIDAGRNPVSLRVAPADSRYAALAPADSLLFLYGTDLYGGVIRGIKEAVARAEDDPDADEFVAGLREWADELKRELGFDYDRDLLAHLTGEFALAAGARDFEMDDAWALAVSGVDDAPRVSRSLALLDDYSRRQGRRVTTTRVGAATVTESTPRGRADDAVAYSLSSNDLIVGTGRATVQQALAPTATLAGVKEYQEALSVLPDSRVLTVFVNLARVVDLARGPMAGSDDSLDWDALAQLRFLAFGLTQTPDSAGGVAFLRIAGE